MADRALPDPRKSIAAGTQAAQAQANVSPKYANNNLPLTALAADDPVGAVMWKSCPPVYPATHLL